MATPFQTQFDKASNELQTALTLAGQKSKELNTLVYNESLAQRNQLQASFNTRVNALEASFNRKVEALEASMNSRIATEVNRELKRRVKKRVTKQLDRRIATWGKKMGEKWEKVADTLRNVVQQEIGEGLQEIMRQADEEDESGEEGEDEDTRRSKRARGAASSSTASVTPVR